MLCWMCDSIFSCVLFKRVCQINDKVWCSLARAENRSGRSLPNPSSMCKVFWHRINMGGVFSTAASVTLFSAILFVRADLTGRSPFQQCPRSHWLCKWVLWGRGITHVLFWATWNMTMHFNVCSEAQFTYSTGDQVKQENGFPAISGGFQDN